MEVLLGGRSTIVKNRPVILMEIEQRHIRHSVQEVFSILCEMQYHGYFLVHDKLTPLSSFTLDQYQNMAEFGTKKYINNFIFTPRAVTSLADILAPTR